MKFSTLATTAAAATAIQATKFTATGGELKGNGVYCVHEGAAINYCFANPKSSPQDGFKFDQDKGTITYQLDESITTGMQVGAGDTPIVQLAPGTGSDKWSVDGGKLAVNGSSSGFYGCMNVNDPYGYSKDAYAIVYYGDVDATTADCTEITIEVDDSGNGGNTTTTQAAPTSTGFSNSTTTAVCTKEQCTGDDVPPTTQVVTCTEEKCQTQQPPATATCTEDKCQEEPTQAPESSSAETSSPDQVNGANTIQVGTFGLAIVGVAAFLAL